MYTTLSLVACLVLWTVLGYISQCVRFGTWRKEPMISLMYSGLGGSLRLNWELVLAQLSGPVVAIKYVWYWWRDSVDIGFERPTNEKFLKLIAS